MFISHLAFFVGLFTVSRAVELSILTKTGSRNATAPELYGWMFEDINHSGDGGIYGELLVNRDFQGSSVKWGSLPNLPGHRIIAQENPNDAFGPVMTGYGAVGNASVRLDNLHPLSASHRTCLAVDIWLASSGPAGFKNNGWWGIPVLPQTYNVSFFVYPDSYLNQFASTSITVSLQSNTTGEVFASTVIPAQSWNVANWTYVEAQIVNTVTAPNVNNTLVITFDAAVAPGQTYYFNQVSLFGETFKNYPNGLRKDIAENLHDLQPKFLRWPGGNNLEGYSVQTRWKWWETIGPLHERWGRPGTWSYYNSGGLGIMEYLNWVEAMGMESVMAVWSGYALVDGEEFLAGEIPPNDLAMYPVLQEALDQLEFCMGSIDTYWGAKRAEYGHPEPFKIKYVEIGNEDYVSASYPFRFTYMYNGIHAKYPDIKLIASGYDENSAYKVSIPAGAMYDFHQYNTPSWFIQHWDQWDNWQEATSNPNVTIFVGEYSVLHTDAGARVKYPILAGAIAEAVYSLGMERNSKVVKLSSYAPSLANFASVNWTPNLFTFSALPSDTILSVSYYLQQLFNRFHGVETVPISHVGDFGPLYWGSSIESDGTTYLKVININSTALPLTVTLESNWTTVNGSIITSTDPNSYNSAAVKKYLAPVPVTMNTTTPSAAGDWVWDVPGYSITVLQFNP